MRPTTAHVAIRPIRCNLVSSESPGVYVEPTTILVGEHSAAVGLRARPIIVIASEPKLTPACSFSEEIKRGAHRGIQSEGDANRNGARLRRLACGTKVPQHFRNEMPGWDGE